MTRPPEARPLQLWRTIFRAIRRKPFAMIGDLVTAERPRPLSTAAHLFVSVLVGVLGISACGPTETNSSCAPPYYTIRVNGSDERVGGCSGQYTYAGNFDVAIGDSITIDRAEWAPRARLSEGTALSEERLSDHRVRLTVKKRGTVDIFTMTRPDLCGSDFRPRSDQSDSPGASPSKPHKVRCYLLSIVGK